MWSTRKAITAHVALAVSEPGFAALAWWQWSRALGGNELSWMYAFEWPFFAGYAVYIWWRIVHDQNVAPLRSRTPASAPQGATSTAGPASSGPGSASGAPHLASRGRAAALAATGETSEETSEEASEEDRRLAAYNRYLAALRAQDRQA